MVENLDEIICRNVGKISQYWDNCGAWGNETKASTPSTVYIRQNGPAMHVVKKEGKYCQVRQSDGRKIFKAIEPQPASKDIFTFRRNYSRHAHSNGYVRHVTWLMEDQSRCLYEYRGKYSGAYSHRKSANPERTGACIRLQRRSWIKSRKLSERRSLINCIGRLMSRMGRGKSVSLTLQNTGTKGVE